MKLNEQVKRLNKETNKLSEQVKQIIFSLDYPKISSNLSEEIAHQGDNKSSPLLLSVILNSMSG